MAKKTSGLGKLFAFTAAVAAIGGVCYVFRDKIKESPLFQSTKDKAGDLYDSVKTKMNKDDDDFFFDDEDDFFDDAANDQDVTAGREYTSITPAAKEDEQEQVSEMKKDNSDSTSEAEAASTEQTTDDTGSEAIPTINFGTPRETTTSDDIVTGYENEGLSDTSEDPDVLADQDKLDF